MSAIKSLIQMIKTNIKYRKQTFNMAIMTTKKRYSGSALGVAWSLVRPILFIFVYWFGIEIGIRGGKPIHGNIPYIFWMMSGIIAWFFISDILGSGGCGAIRRDSHLVTKVVFPVETIPIYNVISYFFTHLMLIALVIVTLAIFGYVPDLYYLQLLFYVGLLFFFICVLCTFLSTLSVISRDFEQFIKSTSMIFFWLSPVLWSPDKLEGTILMKILKLNPFYYFIEGYRDTFIFKIWFFERPYYTIYIIVFLIIFTLVTAYLYNRLHDEFSDVL
ncbi:ABC transporter permease [Anaerofustis stercorihominis]|uniref:Transport permease protein n=1 Tax=Anaerofustis stercorihominis TaxID=214853 RepID=A0A3E3E1U8_9FIRM|nr:ABC transporter permease [Anaerofustis stercorihominis]RGD75517.1 ABC transporter permease [Anaerofustis stercorihominis]